MTSVQFMRLRAIESAAWRVSIGLFAAVGLLVVGCESAPRLEQPVFLHSPYAETQLWAVAPLLNESGVSDIDTARVADFFTEQLQDVDGLHAVPVNRVIRAMRELELDAVRTPGEARLLMNVLDVQGLIVGSISAYDPYFPPKFAAAIELHTNDRRDSYAMLDTRALTRSPTGEAMPGAVGPVNPVAQAAGVFDAANHRTLAQLRDYTRGRHIPDSAFGKDIHLVRMDLYMQFVSFRLIHDLLDFERTRLTPIECLDVAQASER